MLTVLAVLLVLPVTILTLVFTVEVAAGLVESDAPPPVSMSAATTMIIIPAHDEAAIISASLAMLGPELAPGMRPLVVADNCEDDTALIVREAGAEVIERSDPLHRGKGFALAFARDHLRAAPPDVVVVIDADCATDRASLTRLASLAITTGRPVQALNLLRPDLNAPPMVQVSNFAFLVKNLVRQAGLARLSGHVHLTGTGMAFPWALFVAAPLATSDIVEDLGLGLDLSVSGTPPLFAPDASVWSGASSTEGTFKQRIRWEGGFLSTSMRRGPKIIIRALRGADARLFWSGLSLMIPPLALLAVLNALTLTLTSVLIAFGASPLPAVVLIALGSLAGAGVFVTWHRLGRSFLSVAAATRLPLYLLWKLPMYLGFFRRSPVSWLRAGR